MRHKPAPCRAHSASGLSFRVSGFAYSHSQLLFSLVLHFCPGSLSYLNIQWSFLVLVLMRESPTPRWRGPWVMVLSLHRFFWLVEIRAYLSHALLAAGFLVVSMPRSASIESRIYIEVTSPLRTFYAWKSFTDGRQHRNERMLLDKTLTHSSFLQKSGHFKKAIAIQETGLLRCRYPPTIPADICCIDCCD